MTSPSPPSPYRDLVAAALWTLGIGIAVVLPGSYIPGTGWDVDKLVHFAMFFGYAVLWVRALRPRVRRPWLWVLVTGVVYSVGTELLQTWLPDERFGDPYDALADVTGLVLGLLFAARHGRSRSRGTRY